MFKLSLSKVSVKFQTLLKLHPLQSSNTRKIDLYSKHWKNKLQALAKTVLIFKYNTVQTQN